MMAANHKPGARALHIKVAHAAAEWRQARAALGREHGLGAGREAGDRHCQLVLEDGKLVAVLVDSGFFSEQAVRAVEQTQAGTATGTVIHAAVEKTGHHRSVADLEKQPAPAAPAPRCE